MQSSLKKILDISQICVIVISTYLRSYVVNFIACNNNTLGKVNSIYLLHRKLLEHHAAVQGFIRLIS